MDVRPDHILLIQPRSRKFYARTFATGAVNSHPPIGLITLAAVLKRHGYEIRVIDMLVQDISRDAFRTQLLDFRPAVVGLSVLTETCRVAEGIAEEVKRHLACARVVFGGSFPTFEYETVLGNGNIDYVLRFEGEEGLLELMEHIRRPELIPLERIPGLAFRGRDGVCVNPPRRRCAGLDGLPFMERELVSPEAYTHRGTISGGRGCGYRCVFCSSASMFGAAKRVRSAEHLFAEVYYLHEKCGVKDFHFVDQSFTASPSRTDRFCRYLIRSDLAVRWRCMSHVDAVDRDLLALMVRAGCIEIEYGIESGDPSVLAGLGKRTTLARATEVIEWSAELGIKVICFFVLGHFSDTIETMERTIAFARTLRDRYGVEIIARMNTPFPGTFQYEHAEALGLEIHATDWDDFSYAEAIVSNASFSRDQLRSVYLTFLRRVEHHH